MRKRSSGDEATLRLAAPVDLCSPEDHAATCRKKSRSYPLAVYAPWRTRSTCPNPRRMFPHLTCRWEREYEVNVRALSLREEVADRRPWSTGPERPAGLKAGGP